MLLKSFCTAKETTDKKKTLPTELQKILANDKTTKGLISKICKQFIELNMKKQSLPYLPYHPWFPLTSSSHFQLLQLFLLVFVSAFLNDMLILLLSTASTPAHSNCTLTHFSIHSSNTDISFCWLNQINMYAIMTM